MAKQENFNNENGESPEQQGISEQLRKMAEESEGTSPYEKTRSLFEGALNDFSKALEYARTAKNEANIIWAELKIDETKSILSALENGDAGPAAKRLQEMIDENKLVLKKGLARKEDVPAINGSIHYLSSHLDALGIKRKPNK